jgi:hypothetical protein
MKNSDDNSEEGFVSNLRPPGRICIIGRPLFNPSITILLQVWDWENESIPLETAGNGRPKFVGPVDKHSANEGK